MFKIERGGKYKIIKPVNTREIPIWVNQMDKLNNTIVTVDTIFNSSENPYVKLCTIIEDDDAFLWSTEWLHPIKDEIIQAKEEIVQEDDDILDLYGLF